MFWENLKQNPSFSFLSCKYIAYAQNGLCKDKGFFCFYSNTRQSWNCMSGSQTAVFLETLQLCEIVQIYFHGVDEMQQLSRRLCLHHHCLSYATLQKLKQLFMVSLGAVSWTERSELMAPGNLMLAFCIESLAPCRISKWARALPCVLRKEMQIASLRKLTMR